MPCAESGSQLLEVEALSYEQLDGVDQYVRQRRHSRRGGARRRVLSKSHAVRTILVIVYRFAHTWSQASQLNDTQAF